MVLICNSRPSVVAVLDKLKVEPSPASAVRLVRMRGREGTSRDTLMASPEWKRSREMLARSASPPSLKLDAGRA
jgi:hypothetical protein